MSLFTGALPLVPPAGAAAGQQNKGPKVVALGGGHGLSASLSALRLLTSDLTAVVTVADDGGSSGRLREEYGVLPPGDLRMALAALCDDTDWGRTWRDVMQHRFRPGNGPGGSLDEHAMGNLLIVTLWELLGDAVAGLKWAGALLGARGQVLPMSTVPLTIEGDVRNTAPDGGSVLQTIRGQARCAVAGSLEQVRLLPEAAPACVEALTAIELADWVILGPGSWYTSVLPHLLLPEMRQALCHTPAKRCLTMNLATDTKETSGMTAADHLHVLRRYAPGFNVDVVLADPISVPDLQEFEKAAGMIGAEVVVGKVGASGRRPVHDPLRLATAYHDVFGNSWEGAMALTASVKEELSRLDIKKSSVRKAEVSAMLRFAGGLHIISGRIVIEAEVDLASTARRLRAAIAEVYGHQSEIIVVSAGGLRRASRYVVRVVRDGEALARQTGLLDGRGRPVRGLPSAVVNGSAADAEAVWRGAFLAHGSLTEPGRSSSLEVTCPGPESALALVGAARRLDIQAKAREVRGVDRVVIRDGDTIAALLTRMGAHDALMVWEERRMRKEVRATANRLANFDDANLRRSAQAAVAAGARVDRALEILGDDVPDHLKYAGELRVAHKQASLDELGRLADPVMTKDAIAGRIRRLLAMADKRALDLGIPGTDANVTPEMLDE